MKSKGELTTQQIVIMVVLIASFSILLIFLLRFNFKESTAEQLCRNSVILASKSVGSVSLECHTKYLCLSSGDVCESLKSAEVMKVNSDQERVDQISNLLVSCWNMYGKGEYDFISGSWIPGQAKSCGICSEFVLNDISSNDLRTGLSAHLQEAKVPGISATYFQYLKIDDANIPSRLEQKKIYAILFTASKGFKGTAPTFSLQFIPTDELPRAGCNDFFSLA